MILRELFRRAAVPVALTAVMLATAATPAAAAPSVATHKAAVPAGATPASANAAAAAALPDLGLRCKVVPNADGSQSFSACIYVSEYWFVDGQFAAWTVDYWAVWNIPLPKGHSDLLTGVTFYGVDAGVSKQIRYGNIADGGTDDYYVDSWLVPTYTTVWVEVRDPYAPTCQRVFFAAAGAISVTGC